jgi:hypothetical protein
MTLNGPEGEIDSTEATNISADHYHYHLAPEHLEDFVGDGKLEK